MLRFLRSPLLASFALVTLAPALPVHAQVAPRPVQTAEDPWLYKGSDLVHDEEWKFGRLSNGVRYAVRKNGVPPGQVSVRVRIDAGSLNEQDSERGFAHLLEHLSFRGSTFVPDGESKRIWQRLGVTFGSDSNASTTFTETVYKLDLPTATAAGLDESFKILTGMLSAPAITQASLDAERPVVLAEAREQPGAQERMQDAMLGLMFAGQPVANRKPIGTTAALTAATPAAVKAFHDRWYRPDRAVVIVIGDMEPAVLETLVQKHFATWKADGPNPPSPDFGKPSAEGNPVAASIVEPAVPPLAMMAIVRPWTVFSDTVIFNQKRMIDLVAIRIINRRLESRARSGGSFVGAGADLSDVARSANVTTVNVMPVGADWETALRDVRGVIADAQTTAPGQPEIDRELAEIESSMKQRISTAPVEAGAKLADDLVEAVDINETVTTPEASYDIFKAAVAAKMFTPQTVQAAAKRVFEGTAVRALVNTHTPDPQLMTKVTAALQADVVANGGKRRALGNVSFAQLPKLGTPGKMVSRTPLLPELEIEKVVFANGVNLLMRKDSSEVGKVYVNVRFGRGLNDLPARPSPGWAGEMALVAGGVGKLGQEELDALIGKRQIGFDFDVAGDAFRFNGQTNKEDLPDQLRLFAAKLVAPAWDPNPVIRAKTAVLSGYAGLSSSPDAVLGRDLEKLLHSGDPRWGIADRQTIEATTPASFRKLWEPLLATGPIEVEVFGDMDSDATIKAVAETFGALKPRPASKTPVPVVAFPAHADKPVVRTHSGKADQAAAVIAWPTGAGSAGITESRKLEVLAAIFRDRMIDQLRSQAGISYSPNVASQWPLGMESGGKLIALGMVPPDKTEFFFKLARGIAADLIAKPVDADELNRALTPIKQMLIRQSSGNMFWMRLVEGGAFDPARVAAVETLARDVATTSPAEVQALAQKYLRPDRDWTMVVVPGPDAQAGG
ncbi:M16 family metallopeptidase [Sphingomonas psychrotolerans]|uniref:Peptidase M16 n=1 Tax=Sphingomonas psychrotolerans TaxID=1327635 RepID=A0A2K8MI77_9SPHN|nr:M16 family metallopeptidase [Sphingomonas psychrotolerans]ATY33592.1 peptidase M16 [Sphingomonas psychrotolerans]